MEEHMFRREESRMLRGDNLINDSYATYFLQYQSDETTREFFARNYSPDGCIFDEKGKSKRRKKRNKRHTWRDCTATPLTHSMGWACVPENKTKIQEPNFDKPKRKNEKNDKNDQLTCQKGRQEKNLVHKNVNMHSHTSKYQIDEERPTIATQTKEG